MPGGAGETAARTQVRAAFVPLNNGLQATHGAALPLALKNTP